MEVEGVGSGAALEVLDAGGDHVVDAEIVEIDVAAGRVDDVLDELGHRVVARGSPG